MATRCIALIKSGSRCSHDTKDGCELCSVHLRHGTRYGTIHVPAVDPTADPTVDPTVDPTADPVLPLIKTRIAPPVIDSAQVAALDSEIEALTALIKELKIQRKSLTNTSKITTKAKWLFYHDHKTSEDILSRIRPRLLAGGLAFSKTIKIKGMEITKEIIPWQYIKAATDEMFRAEISDEVRAAYFSRARVG